MSCDGHTKRGDLGIGESSPAVGDGMVYIGDLSGILHAVAVQDGSVKWSFQTDGEIRSSPVLADDRVLIGSYDGSLYGLSARNGELVWEVGNEQLRARHALCGGWHRLLRWLR